MPGRVRIKPGCLGRFMRGCGGVCKIIVKMHVMTSLSCKGEPPLERYREKISLDKKVNGGLLLGGEWRMRRNNIIVKPRGQSGRSKKERCVSQSARGETPPCKR